MQDSSWGTAINNKKLKIVTLLSFPLLCFHGNFWWALPPLFLGGFLLLSFCLVFILIFLLLLFFLSVLLILGRNHLQDQVQNIWWKKIRETMPEPVDGYCVRSVRLTAYLGYSTSDLKPLVLVTLRLMTRVLVPRETTLIWVQVHNSLLQWLKVWD